MPARRIMGVYSGAMALLAMAYFGLPGSHIYTWGAIGLLSTAARPHGLMWGARQGASLDHALWLHGPVRLDDWMLSVSESPVAVAGRGLVLGTIHARTGIRLASVAQEGFMRAAR